MRLISYNVNGVRAALTKDLQTWIKSTDPDIINLQEIKADKSVFPAEVFANMGYKLQIVNPAEKKGYSGTATLIHQRIENKLQNYQSNHWPHDNEGRVIETELDGYTLINVYFPSGSSGDERQAYKFVFMDAFKKYTDNLISQGKKIVLCGDINICNKPIDIHNPIANVKSSGFLPEERAWFDTWLDSGLVDTFRIFNNEPNHYTWWTFRAGARARNLGWRIDYFLVSENIKNNVKRALILPEAKHSDHCPILLEI